MEVLTDPKYIDLKKIMMMVMMMKESDNFGEAVCFKRLF